MSGREVHLILDVRHPFPFRQPAADAAHCMFGGKIRSDELTAAGAFAGGDQSVRFQPGHDTVDPGNRTDSADPCAMSGKTVVDDAFRPHHNTRCAG